MAFKVFLSTFTLISFLAPLVFTSDNTKGSCSSEGPIASSHLSGIHEKGKRNNDPYSISLVVYNALDSAQLNLTFHTNIAVRGILLGAMNRIHTANPEKFTFTTIDNEDYGPFLVSVNGLAGNNDDQTYWEIDVQLQNGRIIRPDVGIGCYIPNPDDTVILKFTKW